MEAIVEKFSDMRADLDREKRAMTRLWAKREAQIQVVIESTGKYTKRPDAIQHIEKGGAAIFLSDSAMTSLPLHDQGSAAVSRRERAA